LNAPSRFRREQNHVADPRARAREKNAPSRFRASKYHLAGANLAARAPNFSPSRLRREGKSQQNLTSLTRFGTAPSGPRLTSSTVTA